MKNKEVYKWVIDVMSSCTNYTQLINAQKLTVLYWQMFKDNDDIMIDCEGLENAFYWKCNDLKIVL